MSEQPKISDDGKFYWDGERWVPMSAAGSAQPQTVKVTGSVRTKPARWRYVFWAIFILGPLAFIVWAVMSAK